MGMFDTVYVSQACPFCGGWKTFDAQTKDLDPSLDIYRPLPEDWDNPANQFGKAFRTGMPVCPQFPKDKSHTVWANQAEKIEAAATLDEPYASQLKFVTVLADCPACKGRFTGKVKVQDGKLIRPIFDIVKEGGEI